MGKPQNTDNPMKLLILIVLTLIAYANAGTVFFDDFREGALADNGWKVISGKWYQTKEGITVKKMQHYGPDLIVDVGKAVGDETKYSISSKMKIAKGGAGHCIKYVSNSKKFFCYFLYAENRIYVSTGTAEGNYYSKAAKKRFTYNKWFNLRSDVDGYKLSVKVDGKEVWTADMRGKASSVKGSTSVGLSVHSGAVVTYENFKVESSMGLSRHGKEQRGLIALLEMMENKINTEISTLNSNSATRMQARSAADTKVQGQLAGLKQVKVATNSKMVTAEGNAKSWNDKAKVQKTALNKVNGEIITKSRDMKELQARNKAAAKVDKSNLKEALARAEKELKLIDLITKLVKTGLSK